jgi:hypothetical protein
MQSDFTEGMRSVKVKNTLKRMLTMFWAISEIKNADQKKCNSVCKIIII